MSRVSTVLGAGGELDRLEAVTIEIGRDEASIRAAAYSDGRVGLALGTGQEFVGCWRDLPLKVAEAARTVLDTAEPFVGLLPPQEPGSPPRRGPVRITLRTPTFVFTDQSNVTDLKSGRSPLGPLWTAFTNLMGPMIAALFDTPGSPGGRRPGIPALARAQRLGLTGSIHESSRTHAAS